MNTNPAEQQPDIAPEAIVKLLERTTEQIDADTAHALQLARNRALSHHARHSPVFILSDGRSMHWPNYHSVPHWMLAILLLAILLVSSASYWHHAQENDMSHLDIAILTDDLPMEIFVDR